MISVICNCGDIEAKCHLGITLYVCLSVRLSRFAIAWTHAFFWSLLQLPVSINLTYDWRKIANQLNLTKFCLIAKTERGETVVRRDLKGIYNYIAQAVVNQPKAKQEDVGKLFEYSGVNRFRRSAPALYNTQPKTEEGSPHIQSTIHKRMLARQMSALLECLANAFHI